MLMNERLAKVGGSSTGFRMLSRSGGVGQVVQKAGGQDVGRREVDLETRQIAAGEPAGAVLAARQAATIHVVKGVEAVVEPGASFHQRAENSSRGVHLLI